MGDEEDSIMATSKDMEDDLFCGEGPTDSDDDSPQVWIVCCISELTPI